MSLPVERWLGVGTATTMSERVGQRVDDILQTHQPLPIEDDTMDQLREIVQAADKG